ncbi:MAG: CapA family protein [Novosphingobium sp.]|uniref:CapA family protein n=1 Tax=Novosphingobium sp. TaxID=1874826 RepID=UPI00273646CC|nr:CapA family protein [Novosphingobium sp.]MDP3552259.1 CapA family protein [Novosphingobium sp.]
MREGAISIVLAGDLVLDEPDAPYWLAGIAPALQAADLAVGHLEVPHSARGVELKGDVPAPAAPPENVAAIAAAGFHLLSLAGNHIADCGADGIADTLILMAAAGLNGTGAGLTLAQARTPVVVERGGLNIGLLSYNCVGPEISWATETSAGCAYLRIETADASPIAPAANLECVTDKALATVKGDIAALKAKADFVMVALHKGIVHTPARLAPYERAISHAAIDAGADVVIGHHAHIVRGIEFHRGKPIFHGLGNGCVVTGALSPAQDHPARREWAERRKTLFGFEPDPAYTLAPFHPEAVNAMLGRLTLHPDGSVDVSIVPVDVLAPGRPVLAEGERKEAVARYIEQITVAAGLPPITIAADGTVMA